MREIIFRGKRVDNGEWVYGYYVYAHTDNSAGICSEGNGFVDVDPATVGQYTGLTDKNGAKIFEGDILKTTNSNCLIWFVDYKLTSFCANQGNANYSCELGDFMSVSEVEVIGNIHDNPELLEMEAKHDH